MDRPLATAPLLLALLVFAPTGAPARAQDAAETSPSMQRTARSLYEDGVRAARARQWPEALDAFERSYALYPRPITLMNLAGAQRQTGRLVAASESYRRFLRDASERERSDYGAAIESALAAIDAQIAHATLRVDGLTSADRVQLDGEALDAHALGTEIALDPGEHRVVVARAEQTLLDHPFTLREGERAEVALEIPRAPVREPVPAPAEVAQTAVPAPPTTIPALHTEPASHDDPTPWIIVGVSAGVVAIGVAILVGVLVSEGSGGQLPPGTEPPIRL
ncbi:hypothetical protein [Sandaracinus amylolyticus]|uniref:Thiol-disulfide isomerase n=1 Tax=Sandaracinus amylolyticus TaxID=927083 RepID=A0A0F6SF39_9BACT|nr:hypothetical protein [Sandaracinus amylolyticus]AKF06274.1 Thiol-disulfide isomerase [Sandaracinus amylolyticus]